MYAREISLFMIIYAWICIYPFQDDKNLIGKYGKAK